jgi:threonine/homoserine/homoserine lactone efflux protein
LAGVLLGLSSGLSPGPLLTLVLTQTIKHNRAEGIKVAISPLVTDFSIILITILIMGRLAQSDIFLAIIAFAGGIFLVHLGIESVRTRELSTVLKDIESGSLKKGIITNFLNPGPYLFWATVGTPLMFRAYKTNLTTAILFMISFYVFLTGSKIIIAILAEKTKHLMNQKTYSLMMKILGIALLIFSLIFFYDGIKYLMT